MTAIEMRVQKELTLFYSCSDEPVCMEREFYHLQSGVSDTEDTRFLYCQKKDGTWL